MKSLYEFEIIVLAHGVGDCPEGAFADALLTLEKNFESAIDTVDDVRYRVHKYPFMLMQEVPGEQ